MFVSKARLGGRNIILSLKNQLIPKGTIGELILIRYRYVFNLKLMLMTLYFVHKINFKNRNRKLNSAYSTSKKVTSSFFSVVVSNGKIPQPQLITALEKN